MTLDIIFSICATLILYTYILYAGMIKLLSIRKNQKIRAITHDAYTVSIIIAAYNEEKYIYDKIINALSVRYDERKLSVIVVSDGSTDKTLEITNGIRDKRLIVLNTKDRKGKPNAINTALEFVKSDIVILTDANVFFQENSIRQLLGNFNDPKCGCACGNVILTSLDDGEILGEGAYMRYEKSLFESESDFYSMAGIDGGMYAIRTELLDKLPKNVVLDDMYIALNVVRNGYVVKYNKMARAIEKVPASVANEFNRKVRIAAGCFQILKLCKFAINPFYNFKLFFIFVSHKLIRWLSPIFLFFIFTISIVNIKNDYYLLMLMLQTLFYSFALIGLIYKKSRNYSAFYFPYYFSTINLAFAIGLTKYFLSDQKVTWKQTRR